MFVAVVCVSYPRKSRASLHRAHCYMPAALAAIFDESPSLIAPVVHAFYHRDPLDLKVLLTSPVITFVHSSLFNMLECEFVLTSMSKSTRVLVDRCCHCLHQVSDVRVAVMQPVNISFVLHFDLVSFVSGILCTAHNFVIDVLYLLLN